MNQNRKILWSDWTKSEHFDLDLKYAAWRKPVTAHQLTSSIPALGCGGVFQQLGHILCSDILAFSFFPKSFAVFTLQKAIL